MMHSSAKHEEMNHFLVFSAVASQQRGPPVFVEFAWVLKVL